MKLLADLIRKPLVWAVGAIILLLLCWWLISTLIGGANARTEAKLARSQAEAAIESGTDAVTTIGKQIATESADDALTRKNDHEIRTAPGADAPVDPAAARAGLRSLCARRAYRERPECLQYAAAP